MENIKACTREGLADLMEEMGQPRFRVKQIVPWLYQRGVSSYDEMTDLPAKLREELKERAPLYVPEMINRQVSKDGTRKYVWRFHDGACVETVAMPSREGSSGPSRLTVCFSTQVGCPMACAFCATGREGFTRNLTPGEMVDQILLAGKDMGMRVSNVVAMGQGEPFLNYDNVIAALRFVNAKDGLGIGARHITVSTCGVLSGIEKFAREKEQFTLALSLHSAVQATRDKLMPKMSSTPLPELKSTMRDYVELSGRRATLEYLLIKGVNDDDRQLEALKRFCHGMLCHVNILPVNDVEGSPFKPASKQTVAKWISELERAGVETTLRDSRGADIDGACGQLKNAMNRR